MTIQTALSLSIATALLGTVTTATIGRPADVQRHLVWSSDGRGLVACVPVAGPAAESTAAPPVGGDGPAWRGATWTRVSCPAGLYIRAVSMATADVGFAAAELGVVLRTLDGGSTWQVVLNQGFPFYYYGVHAFTADTVVVTGFQNQTGEGVLRWSDNGGANWGPVISLPAPTYFDWLAFVKFTDADHGVIQGWGGGAWYALTGGRTAADWNFTQPTDNWWQGPFTFLSDGRVWMTGYDNFRSTDFGATWTPIADADPLFDGANSILPSGKGFIGSGTISPSVSGWVYATDNGGDSWTPAPVLTTPYPIRALLRVTASQAWAVGGNYYSGVGGIWATDDGGETWGVEQETGAELLDITTVRIPGTALMDVYAVGMVSQIWRTRVPAPPLPGDLNCDGTITFEDINPFIDALSDPALYQQLYPDCNILNGDGNGDGLVDFDDINPFVELLAGP